MNDRIAGVRGIWGWSGRRRGLFAATAAAVVAGGAGVFALRPAPALGEGAVTVATAHDMAMSGAAVLVDVRRPDEWAATGVGEGAVPVDLRDADFVARLDALTAGDRATPVALICAGGVRSRRVAARLRDAGFTNIIDVPEGMSGSAAGPGWVASGLPVAPPG